MVREDEASALLARQNGLITTEQAARCGMSTRMLRRRVLHAGWRRVAPSVLLVAGHPVTDAVRVRAAGLWIGERGAVSGVAAAYWHRMCPSAPAKVEVTVLRRTGLRGSTHVRVRRRDLHVADVVVVSGIRVTGKALSAVEAARVLPDGAGFLDRALQRHVSFRQVYEAYCRTMGSPGAARSAELLIAAADRADSAAERLLTSLLRRSGLGGWVRSHPFGPWLLDVAFVQARVAVEVDGWAWHTDVDRFRADRRKGNALANAGWNLLRFTWHDLSSAPGRVLSEIRAALARAA